MVSQIWNYLRGYVIIRVYGFSTERFLNLLSVKDLYVWNVKRSGRVVSCFVRLSSLEDVKKYAEKTGCSVEVLKEGGLSFKLKRLKGRQLFAIGSVMFAAIMFFMAMFVWEVSFSGNKRLGEEKLASFCRQHGLFAGGLKSEINPKEISNALVEEFDDISWAAVEIKGTKATVKIVETIEKAEVYDKTVPNDVVAAKDGVIESIVSSRGLPVAVAGDVVAKGDLLIASEIPVKDGEETKAYDYAAAEGSVMARVIYSFTAYVDFLKTEKIYTGESFKDTALIFGKNTLNVFKPTLDGEKFDTYVSQDICLKIGDFKLPFGIKRYEYRTYYEKEKIMTEEEAKTALNTEIENRFEEVCPINSLVVDKYIEYILEGNGLKAYATLTVSEDIAQKDFNIRRSASGGNEGEIAGD